MENVQNVFWDTVYNCNYDLGSPFRGAKKDLF